MKKMKARIQPLYYGDEPPKAPEGTPPAGTPPAGTPPPAEKKVYTQADIDAIVGKTKGELQKKFDREQQAALERMKMLETDAAAKANLEKQIEDLNNRYKSKEELAAEALKREQEKHAVEAKKATDERDAWRKKYEEQTLTAELTSATSRKTDKYEVHNPTQLARFLRPDATVIEKVVDGKPTGHFETRIKYVDSKGKELTCTPDEVVKLMSEDPAHGNFFKAGVVGGINGTGKQGTGSDGRLGMTQDEFNKRYREGTIPKRN